MKRNIIENKIRRMVEEEILRSRVRAVVSEAVYSRIGGMLREDKGVSEKEMLNAVITMMRDPKINKAQIWYEILDMDEDTARGYGDKILKGERDWPPGALRKAYKLLRNYDKTED